MGKIDLELRLISSQYNLPSWRPRNKRSPSWFASGPEKPRRFLWGKKSLRQCLAYVRPTLHNIGAILQQEMDLNNRHAYDLQGTSGWWYAPNSLYNLYKLRDHAWICCFSSCLQGVPFSCVPFMFTVHKFVDSSRISILHHFSRNL